MKTSSEKWVVLVSETMDGETVCQVVSDEYDSREEAEEFARGVDYLNAGAEWLVEVCTVEEASQVVTE